MSIIALVTVYAVVLTACLWGFKHYYGRASAAKRSAQFLDRVGHGSDTDQLAVLDNKPQRYAKAPWLQKLLRDMPLINETAELIDSSGLQLTVAMLLAQMLAAVALGTAVGHLMHRDGFLTLLLALAGASAPVFYVQRMRSKRALVFESQLPQALELIALYLKSGRSLPQAFTGATEELIPPASEEFYAAAEEYRLGRPLDVALRKLAQRYADSIGFRLFAIAVSVLGQTGGNLVEVLERIKRTLDANVTYTLRLRAMTGEARTSAAVLGALPGIFMVASAFMNKDYFPAFTSTLLGQCLFGLFFFIWFSGLIWVRQLMRSTLS